MIERIVEAFFVAYLVNRDAEKTLSFLDEDIEWIGTGESELVFGKDEAAAALSEELSAEPWPCRISYHTVNEREMVSSCPMLFCTVDVERDLDGVPKVDMRLRCSVVCRNRNGEWKIIFMHASVASPAQREGEYFPTQADPGENEKFEQHIRKNSLDILSKNIPGGMMGGYLEPGFPLYYINARMLAHIGYTYEEFVETTGGMVSNCMHPDDRKHVDRIVQEAFRENREYEVQYRMITKSGNFIWVNDIGKKGISEDGREVCLSVVRDITDEVEAERRLTAEVKEREQQAVRYNRLFQSVLCGITQVTIGTETREVYFKDANREAIRIFGYTAEEFWRKKSWKIEELIAASDIPSMMGRGTRLNRVGEQMQVEYRVLRKDKTEGWIIGTVELIQDLDGEILYQSVVLDVNESKLAKLKNRRLQERVLAGNELIRLALENTSVYEFYYYPKQRRVVHSKRACEHYGFPEYQDNMPESLAEEFIAPEYRKAFITLYDRLNQGEKNVSKEIKLKRNEEWCRVTLSAIRYEGEGPAYVVGILEDITKTKEMEFALSKSETKDRLTGAYKREIGLHLVREYMEHKDPDQVCAMMILDMDGFSALNTEEGRAFGDAVLQEVAEILRSRTGPEDIQVRLGGDEFLLFVKDCNKDRATRLGPKIAKEISELSVGGQDGYLVSASIGMCVTAVVNEYSGLYRCAESTLQYVKENCKGQAACYLDTSNELGTMLIQVYTGEHLFNEIDSSGNYQSENMVDFALELLGKARRLDDAMNLLLAKIGNRCRFDRVSILEVNQEYCSYSYTYQWARNKADLQMGRVFYVSSEEYEAFPDYYGEDGLCGHPLNPNTAMGSCLHAAVWNQGAFAGAMGFEMKKADYPWTEEQKQLLREITKVVASFIMKARADSVSRAKTDFLSRMSHEIRTPMNAISGMTTIAKTVVNDPDKITDCLNKIDTANVYLLNLINDILDMSRIESGKIELNYEPVYLNQVQKQLLELLRPQAEAKGISLTFVREYPEDQPVKMDVLRFNQVIINIVGNAVKFTPAGGRVEVKANLVRKTEDMMWVRFSVKDTGIGIAPEAQSRIFGAFEQEDPGTASKYGGTGLGLSISSHLVRMMGGDLAVASKAGKGAEFYFTLPLDFSAEPVEKKAETEAPGGGEYDFSGKRLLLAEDNDLNREIAVSILEMRGFLVEAAVDGRQALNMFLSNAPGYYDGILMDIRMPVLNGLEATRLLRTCGREDARRIPIIAMTANAFDEDTKKSITSGMNGHLTKPINIDALFGMLGEVLQPS